MTILVQQLRAEIEQLQAEIKRLGGARPDFPPRPPDGDGLPRYGIRWNGPQDPLTVPMEDGYWTPWHLADQLKAENAELKARTGKAVGPMTLGLLGKAFDPPGTHRAYTYAEQPNNQGAWRLGEALVEAHAMPAGDHIDGGLGLLKALQLRGFGVFETERAMTKEQP